MLKINMDLSYEAKWYDFETGEPINEPMPGRPSLKIKPYPLSEMNILFRDGGIVIPGKDRLKIFKESLVEMNAIVGMDDKPVPCTDEAKEKIFNLRLGDIAVFVLNKNVAFHLEKRNEEKNSLR